MSADVSATLLRLAAALAEPKGRAASADALAAAVGAETLMIFVRDEEVGELLPARGFPQTLPNGKTWRSFLSECVEHGHREAELQLRLDGSPRLVRGFSQGTDSVVVFIGGEVKESDVEWVRALLALFAAAFRGERAAVLAEVQTQQARDGASRSAVAAKALDRTRRQLEDALAEARDARSQLERTFTRLAEHSVELENANQQLREQADAMEAQAMELELQAHELQGANTALRDARRIAEAANGAKSQFLATMSHELRTPLNAIGGHSQLIDMGVYGPVTPGQHEALVRIDRSQRHLLGLINDVLNLSRIEAGRVHYVMEDVDLGEALADLQPMIEPQLAAKSLRYEIRDADPLPMVRADREKLQQVLLNLLSNAVKFTDPGDVVRVDGGRCPDGSGRVFVRVTDTGRGIPPDKLEVIFEPFIQVDASHSRLGQGMGLGLAISRDLARGMGGELQVESVFGSWSAFMLTLQPGSGADPVPPVTD